MGSVLYFHTLLGLLFQVLQSKLSWLFSIYNWAYVAALSQIGIQASKVQSPALGPFLIMLELVWTLRRLSHIQTRAQTSRSPLFPYFSLCSASLYLAPKNYLMITLWDAGTHHLGSVLKNLHPKSTRVPGSLYCPVTSALFLNTSLVFISSA